MHAVDIIFNPLTGVLAGYMLVATVLAVITQPMRREMVQIANEIYADQRFSEADYARVEWLLDTCMSFKVGLIVPVAALGVIFDDLLKRKVHDSRGESGLLSKDRRFLRLMVRYFISVLAMNPIAAVVAVILLATSMAVHLLLNRKDTLEAVEEPIMRAAYAVQTKRMELTI